MKQAMLPIQIAALFLATLGSTEFSHADAPELGVKEASWIRLENWELHLQALDDDLVRLSIHRHPLPNERWGRPKPSPMIGSHAYMGPTKWRADRDRGEFETAELRVKVDPRENRVTVYRRHGPREHLLTRITIPAARKNDLEVELDPTTMTHVYGLGEQFGEKGRANGNWVGRRRTPGCTTGNHMVEFNGGTIGNAQFPIMYALGNTDENYALFVDHVPSIEWDFTGRPWRLRTTVQGMSLYVMSGPDLPDLRRDYMELVGRPPVPPKKMFGLWVSEYGYENWAELEDKLRTLRSDGFPLDGFVMDLQWFGGIDRGGPKSRMGNLTWDTKHFPNPAAKIGELGKKHGVGLITIEEPFVCKNLPDHKLMSDFFAHFEAKPYTPLLREWWGEGGMIDFTNPQAGDSWHDRKRQELVRQGVLGHWTDLSEPEITCNAKNFYRAGSEFMVRNLYAFHWAESIQRGYARNKVERRPFILTRSGTSGIQRFGAAMWSGDIGSNLSSLAAHLSVQMHMSLSGVDYFGADVGGFKREACNGDTNEMYTQWFADACAFDVPVRPHTSNLENKYETAPDRIGHVASNRENLLQRYRLLPYLYSLAHQAYRTGDAVFPPLVYCFQNDLIARDIGDEKMIGPHLLVAAAAKHGLRKRDVYLPAGCWTNFHTGAVVQSAGQWLRDVPLRDEKGIFRLPMFVREGAILPLLSAQALRRVASAPTGTPTGERANAIVLRLYPSEHATTFALYEDDGETGAYQSGQVRETIIRQQWRDDKIQVTIESVRGQYAGAPEHRSWLLEVLAPPGREVSDVRRNGRHLPLPEGPATTAWRTGGGWATTTAIRLGSGDQLVFSLSKKR